MGIRCKAFYLIIGSCSDNWERALRTALGAVNNGSFLFTSAVVLLYREDSESGMVV